jgi:hypothetical protein
MSTYFHTTTHETRDFNDAWFAAAVAAGNPKVSGWALQPAAPSYNSSTQHAPEWINGQWVTQNKTAEELAVDARKIWPSSADFWANFIDTEKLAILASTIAGIILLREELRLWTGAVWSDDTRVQSGLAGLVAVGILTDDRKQAILKP